VVGDIDRQPIMRRVLLTSIVFSTIALRAGARGSKTRIDRTSFVSLGGLERWVPQDSAWITDAQQQQIVRRIRTVLSGSNWW